MYMYFERTNIIIYLYIKYNMQEVLLCELSFYLPSEIRLIQAPYVSIGYLVSSIWDHFEALLHQFCEHSNNKQPPKAILTLSINLTNQNHTQFQLFTQWERVSNMNKIMGERRGVKNIRNKPTTKRPLAKLTKGSKFETVNGSNAILTQY